MPDFLLSFMEIGINTRKKAIYAPRRVFFEVKPTKPYKIEIKKMAQLAHVTQDECFLFYGSSPLEARGLAFAPNGLITPLATWMECMKCKLVRIEVPGWGARCPCGKTRITDVILQRLKLASEWKPT